MSLPPLELASRAAEPPSAGLAPRKLQALDPRVHRWDPAALNERPCPFCGGQGPARFERPDGLLARACATCAGWYVSPAPAQAQLDAFYHDYESRHRVEAFLGTAYEQKGRQPSLADPQRLVRRIRSRARLPDLRMQELASLCDLARARALDVGCGTGQDLERLQLAGAHVAGVDVDAAAVAFVRDHLRIADVRMGGPDAWTSGECFDLVLLHDVLEHVLAPRALLVQSLAHVRPGGLLSLWTPDGSQAAQEQEPIVLRTDFEHLQFLAHRTVQHLAAELQLELVHMESVGWLGSLEDRQQSPGPRPHPRARDLLRRLPGFRFASRLRHALRGWDPQRAGRYHLFCVLRKGT